MSINEVGQPLANVLNKSSSLFISYGDDFARELTLGQIIKGKVLRSYDGGRYQVDFGGQQKTVDSAVPLKTGELIQGRVVNVGEKIEIKRLPVTKEQASQLDNSNVRQEVRLGLTSNWDAYLMHGMRDYNVKFSALQRADIVKVMRQVDKPQKVILSAAAMLKQNIGISQELLLMLNQLQSNQQSLSLFDIEQLVPKLAPESNVDVTGLMQSNNETQQSVVAAISQLVLEQESKARNDGADQDDITESLDENNKLTDTQQKNDNALSEDRKKFKNMWHLVNNQVDGSTQHRVTTLPIWMNERLIEVDVVMYEQHENSRSLSSIDNKKIVFSLELGQLGNVSIEILLNNKHVKMAISTDSSYSTEILLGHGVELTESIKDKNWSLDEMSYLTKETDEIGNVISSVLEHYVSQDSLSRLM